MGFDNSKWSGHRVDLLRYVGRRVDDAALREDIVQEAIIRLLAYQAKPGITIANITGLRALAQVGSLALSMRPMARLLQQNLGCGARRMAADRARDI